MRILFISNYFPPHEIGGYEQLCRDVAVRLAERGHQVQVLTSRRGGDTQPDRDKLPVLRWLQLQPDPDSRLHTSVQFFLTRRKAELGNLRALQMAVERFAPDIIFIWNLESLPRSIALEAESLPGVATAYWLAGNSPAEPDEFWRFWDHPSCKPHMVRSKAMVGKVALSILRSEGKPERPQMRHVAVVSEYMRRKGIDEGVLPLHTRVIYNGVEIDEFLRAVPRAVDGPLYLLQAGRINPDKGVHTSIEAVAHLVREDPTAQVHLYIAGAGPAEYDRSLRQLVDQSGIPDKVSFLGFLPRAGMPDLMAKCHVLLLPTVDREAFARVVLEAMASGLAVIGTLTGGTGELLQDQVTGLAFAEGDSMDLARQIRRVLSDTNLRCRLATAGQELVCKQFSIERMMEALEDFLVEALHSLPL